MCKYSVLKNIRKFTIALSWDFNQIGVTDLDIFVLLLDADNVLPSPQHLIFYENLYSLDDAIQHAGDNLTGKGEGWDEAITGYLNLLDPAIQSILVGISVHDQKELSTFKLFKNAQVNLNFGSHVQPIELVLDDSYSQYKNLILGHFIKSNQDWLFRFDLEGVEEEFKTFIKQFFSAKHDFEMYRMQKS